MTEMLLVNDQERGARMNLERLGFAVRDNGDRIRAYANSLGRKFEDTLIGEFSSCVEAIEIIRSRNTPKEYKGNDNQGMADDSYFMADEALQAPYCIAT
jgi:hypothetical protein